MPQNNRSMNFRAGTVETFEALEQAARLTNLRHLSSDADTGTIVFTAGFVVMTFGEKVTAQIKQTGPDTVNVTLSSNLQFGMVGWTRKGTHLDRLANALAGILPAA